MSKSCVNSKLSKQQWFNVIEDWLSSKENQLIGSMSRRANCWDNAVAESFFHTLKTELVYVTHYQSRAQARQSIFQYIEGYYNAMRMHSAIDYRTPNEVEYAA